MLSLLREADRHTRIQLTIPGAILRARDEHAELVSLCQRGRFAQARDLLEDHVKHSGVSLRDFLRSRSAPLR